MTKENKELLKRLVYRYGNISEEEKRVNEQIKQTMGGWTPLE